MSNIDLTKEQDKAFEKFTDFLKEVVDLSEKFHSSKGFEKEKYFEQLSSKLHDNFNWSKVLSEDEINNLVKQMKERIN